MRVVKRFGSVEGVGISFMVAPGEIVRTDRAQRIRQDDAAGTVCGPTNADTRQGSRSDDADRHATGAYHRPLGHRPRSSTYAFEGETRRDDLARALCRSRRRSCCSTGRRPGDRPQRADLVNQHRLRDAGLGCWSSSITTSSCCRACAIAWSASTGAGDRGRPSRRCARRPARAGSFSASTRRRRYAELRCSNRRTLGQTGEIVAVLGGNWRRTSPMDQYSAFRPRPVTAARKRRGGSARRRAARAAGRGLRARTRRRVFAGLTVQKKDLEASCPARPQSAGQRGCRDDGAVPPCWANGQPQARSLALSGGQQQMLALARAR